MAVLYKHAIARADCSRETITTLAQKATAVRGMNLYAQMHW